MKRFKFEYISLYLSPQRTPWDRVTFEKLMGLMTQLIKRFPFFSGIWEF